MAPKTDYAAAFEDSVFTFLVGPNEKKFQVHPKVITSLSAPMQALMGNGMMMESLERTASLPETEPEIFALFMEYAYTGHYHVGTPRVIPTELPSSQNVRYCVHCGDRVNKKTPSQLCTKLFCLASYVHNMPDWFCAHCGGDKEMCESVSECYGFDFVPHTRNNEFLKRTYKVKGVALSFKQVAFTGILCRHAKLYVLADQYMMEPLKDLCLAKLHQELCLVTLNKESILEICGLVQYVSSFDSIVVHPLLQDLVIGYLLFEARNLFEYPEFNHQVAQGGAFVAWFARDAVRNLTTKINVLASRDSQGGVE